MTIVKTYLIFILASIFEIGGGYLIWLFLKGNKSVWYGVAWGIALILYGTVATWQTANFAKVCATYGWIFIVMSLLWAYKFDNYTPNRYEVIGALIALLGVSVIYFSPRQ